MDTTINVNGNWDAQKADLKRRFAVLTNNEAIIEEGKKKDMFDKLHIEIIKTNDKIVDWKTRILALLTNTVL